MNVKNLVLGVGIFIVYLMVLNYGIEAIYPSPQYDTFCSGQQQYYYYDTFPKAIGNGVNCTVSPTPQQQDQCMQQGGSLISASYDANGCAATFECDFCNKNYTEAQKDYSQIVFVISFIIGVLTVFVGYLVLSTEPVGSALMASGVGAMVYGSMRNWQNFSTVWRFLLLLVSLVLLVWIALRLNRSTHKKSKK